MIPWYVLDSMPVKSLHQIANRKHIEDGNFHVLENSLSDHMYSQYAETTCLGAAIYFGRPRFYNVEGFV